MERIMKLRDVFGNLVVVILLILPSAALSNTWYVDGVNGIDSNNCETASAACKTITQAISLASSGDSIMIAPATYYENLTIPISLNIVGANPNTTTIHPAVIGPSIITIPNSSSQVALSGLTIAGGRSNRDGGAISNFGQLMITDCIIANNKAQFFGGAIATHGTIEGDRALLWVNKSSIFDNEAPQGGGIECSLPSYVVRITNSTISNNRAVAGNGGGIMGSFGSVKQCQLVIVNSTITGNTAGLGGGGGIYGFARISSSTIFSNSAASGGGISNLGAEIQNSILAYNDGGNCAPSSPQNPTSFGYNLSTDASCPLNSAGDQNNTDIVLGLLQNNGGPTQTVAILLGSPAIDAGNPAGCTDDTREGNVLKVDQRGDRRPGDPKLTTGCDIGAYEYQFPK
jgi:hypothetical protein